MLVYQFKNHGTVAPAHKTFFIQFCVPFSRFTWRARVPFLSPQ